MELTGFAYVTGAANGIGRATSFAYVEAGVAGICLVDIDAAPLAEVVELCKDLSKRSDFQVISYVADVCNEEMVVKTVHGARAAFGRIDYAANIAGILDEEFVPFSDLPTCDFDAVYSVNTRGLFFCLREELRVMKEQEPVVSIPGRPAARGAIVNMASAAAHVAVQKTSAYVATKHAVLGLTRSAATDHAGDGIRVNCISPGFIDTGAIDRKLAKFPGLLALMEDGALQKRVGKPVEVADLVIFFSSERASFITGQSLVADGGFTVC